MPTCYLAFSIFGSRSEHRNVFTIVSLVTYWQSNGNQKSWKTFSGDFFRVVFFFDHLPCCRYLCLLTPWIGVLLNESNCLLLIWGAWSLGLNKQLKRLHIYFTCKNSVEFLLAKNANLHMQKAHTTKFWKLNNLQGLFSQMPLNIFWDVLNIDSFSRCGNISPQYQLSLQPIDLENTFNERLFGSGVTKGLK